MVSQSHAYAVVTSSMIPFINSVRYSESRFYKDCEKKCWLKYTSHPASVLHKVINPLNHALVGKRTYIPSCGLIITNFSKNRVDRQSLNAK